jgi:hypothetical protein
MAHQQGVDHQPRTTPRILFHMHPTSLQRPEDRPMTTSPLDLPNSSNLEESPNTSSEPTLDLKFLRKTAEAATPGPWESRQGAVAPGKMVVGPRESNDLGRGPVVLMHPIFWDKRSAANADHIASFNPAAVLALLDRLENAEFEARRNGAYADIARGRVEAMTKAREEARARVLAAETKVAAADELVRNHAFDASADYGRDEVELVEVVDAGDLRTALGGGA